MIIKASFADNLVWDVCTRLLILPEGGITMKYCTKCGAQLKDDAKFCADCGTPCSANAGNAGETFTQSFKNLNNTSDSTAEFDSKDIEENKAMGIFAYLSFLVLIPIFAAKTSAFARYHSNQGLVLFIVTVAYSIVSGILNSLILAISWRLYFLTSIISMVGIVFTVLAIIGVVNAYKGEKKPLPVIGGINILK